MDIIDHINIVEESLIEQLKLDRVDGEYRSALAKCNLHSIHEELEGVENVIKEKKEGTVAALREARRETLYYLLNVKADWQELSKKQQFLNLMTAPKYNELVRRINLKKNELEKAIPKGEVEGESSQHQDSSWFNPNPKIYRWSSQAAELKNIHGFEDKGMIMERMLVKEGVGSKAVGIVGRAGVGKTALCQLAFNSRQVRSYFPLRIWLCFSNQSNPHEDDAMKKILSCLGFEDELIEEVGKVEKLQVALRSQLKRGRYLIVLDDVWITKVEEAESKFYSFLIGDGDGDGDGAGTLIFTSRYENLDKMLGLEIKKHTLLPLADDESCWNIFSDAVGQEPDEMMKLKKDIVAKCEGLPLMAKMLGLVAHNDLANQLALGN